MHPVNRVLALFGLQLLKTPKRPKEFLAAYRRDLRSLERNRRGFAVFKEMYYDAGEHPEGHGDFECRFAARQVMQHAPRDILDVGSYRFFILGLLANLPLTTVDVRNREAALANERVVVSDAKSLALPDRSFDMVTSLCSLEHFGLGRYGDEIDVDGDIKGIGEMVRVLKAGGRLVFSTSISRAEPAIAFNAHRIYSREMLHMMCAGLECEEERFFSNSLGRECRFDEVTTAPRAWDVYAGCWKKA